MLPIHVLFVAPLSTGHMAQPCADQHEGGVAIREDPHHTGPAADLPAQPLNFYAPFNLRNLLYLILLHFCLLSYVSELLALFFYGFGGMGLKSGFPGSHPSFPRSMRGGGGMTASSSPA